MAFGVGKALAELIVKIKADTTKLHSGLDGAEKSTKSFASNFSKHMKVAGAAMAGLGVAIAGFAIKAALNMGTLYSEIAAGTGATGEVLEGLKKTFKDVAGSVALDTASVASIITGLNTALGLTGEPLKALAYNLAEVSRMLGEDATQATTAFTQALNRWEIPLDSSAGFLDKLFVASQQTGISISGISSLMSEYGSILKNVGYSTEEAIALFSGLYKAGLPVTRIMPALNAATRKFAEAGIDLKAGLKAAFEAMEKASSSAEALAIATGVFGAEGAQRLTDAVRAGHIEFADLTESLVNAEGAVVKFSDATKDPATKLAELKNKVQMLMATLGEAFLPALESLVKIFTPIVEGLGKIIEKFPTLSAVILTAVTALGMFLLLGPKLVGMATMVAGAMVRMGGSLVTIIPKILMVVGALIAKAIAAIAAGIAATMAWLGPFAIPMILAGAAAIGTGIWALVNRFSAPALAEGGIVTSPTIALIGERGPEAVVPLSGAGGIGRYEIHIHVGAMMGSEPEAREFSRLIHKYIRQEDRRTV